MRAFVRFADGVASDVRHAIRSLRRMPLLAAVVIVSLAAGVGANTVVFSWVQAALLRPLPGITGGAGLYTIETVTPTGGHPASSWPEYEDLRRELRPFESLIAFRMLPFYVGDRGGAGVDRAYGQLVSDNFFEALGVRPALGRFPMAADRDQPVVVASYGFWQSRLGASPSAIGQTLTINGQPMTVLAVTPREFQGTVLGLAFEIWAPAWLAPRFGSQEFDARGSRGITVMGPLASRATRVQAQREIDAAMDRLARAYPESNTGLRAEVLTLSESLRGPQRLLGSATLMMQAIMLVLLAAVCANTATLLLARASARQRDAAVRLALGARPSHVMRLLLTESMLLAVAGAAGGVAIAAWGTRGLLTLPLMGFPIRFEAPLNAGGLMFATGLALTCGLLVGGTSAWRLAHVPAQAALRGGIVDGGASAANARQLLLGVQAGLAVVVLVVAALFLRSFLEAKTLNPGFTREGVLLAAYDLGAVDRGVADRAQVRRDAARRIISGLSELPGVTEVAIGQSVPLDIHGLPMQTLTIGGRARADGRDDDAAANTVTTRYFDAMQIPFLAGRRFSERVRPGAVREAIVNVTFARRYLEAVSPADAISRGLRSYNRDYVIVGVVADSISNAFGEPPTPAMYSSFEEVPPGGGEIHVRTSPGREAALGNNVRQTLKALVPGIAVVNVRTLSQHVDSNLILRRVPAQMFAVLGPLLLILAALGVYAAVDYAVARRSAEIGLRLALGSSVRNLVATFVAQYMTAVVGGAVIGGMIALIIAIDIGRIEWWALLGVPAALLATACAAAWWPVWRGAQLDPTAALRRE